MAAVTILCYKHSVDGHITIEVDGATVSLKCRWPFDLSTDEWTYVNNEFSIEAYRKAIQQLLNGGSARIPGVRSGHLLLQRGAEGATCFEASDDNAVYPRTLAMTLNVPPSSFVA